jgi:NADPH:quinone reductase
MNANERKYRSAVCTSLIGPNAIEIQLREVAPLQPGQLRIAIRAAGLNFPDLLMTYGRYQYRPEPPFTPGMEFAGEVTEIAGDVNEFAVGDRVMGTGKGGCFADQIVVTANDLVHLPPTLSFEEGACWHTAAITAWHALHDKAALCASESILILGASGGVGMAAVKLAKHMGAAVIAVASSEEKRAAVLDAGADYALDPADPELAAKVKAFTSGEGANVIYDPVGGALSLIATRAIAWGGRYLIIGFASGEIPKFPANHALIKGYSLIGLRAGESGRRDPALAMRTKVALSELAAQGIMRPNISHRFTLDNVKDAFAALESRSVIGRAVIVPNRA